MSNFLRSVDHFNNTLGVVRSRIERLFSFFDLFSFFGGTDYDAENASAAMKIIVAVFYAILASNPQYDRDLDDDNRNVKPNGTVCHCNNTLSHEASFDPETIRQKYLEIAKEIEYNPKKSRKRSRRCLSWREEMYYEQRNGREEGEAADSEWRLIRYFSFILK